MKNAKRILTLALALMMVLSLAITASADETTYTITINNDKDGHTYQAYQIFTGTLSNASSNDDAEDTNATLSNVQWGANANKTGAATEADLTDLTIEKAISYVNFATDPVGTSTDAGTTYVISGLKPGYYLVKDKDDTLNGTNDAYTSYIVEVVENSTVSPKSSVPFVEKKVDDKNDSNTSEDAVVWQDSADYDIGDAVPFKLTATLASNVTAYAGAYKIVFHDTLDAGLTYNGDATIYVGDNLVYDQKDETKQPAGVSVSHENGKLTITIADAKADSIGAANSSVITVYYTAELNENAIHYETGNVNKVYLEYANNPNWVAPPDDGNPDTPPEEPDTGKTPEDKVIVFTYKAAVDKVHKNPDYDPDADDNTEGTDDQEFVPLVGASFTLYKKLSAQPAEGSGVDYVTETAEGITTYWEVKGTVDGTNASTFTWQGLDDGDYKLVETVTPAGYNTIEPIFFSITASHTQEGNDPRLITLSGDGMTVEEDGTLTTQVENKAGVTLPETGGMGTTLFYVIGGLLVAAAIVLLVTKKRMASAE